MYCECGEFLLSFILNNFFPFFSGVIAKLSERGKESASFSVYLGLIIKQMHLKVFRVNFIAFLHA
jgi:hypothetical protein